MQNTAARYNKHTAQTETTPTPEYIQLTKLKIPHSLSILLKILLPMVHKDGIIMSIRVLKGTSKWLSRILCTINSHYLSLSLQQRFKPWCQTSEYFRQTIDNWCQSKGKRITRMFVWGNFSCKRKDMWPDQITLLLFEAMQGRTFKVRYASCDSCLDDHCTFIPNQLNGASTRKFPSFLCPSRACRGSDHSRNVSALHPQLQLISLWRSKKTGLRNKHWNVFSHHQKMKTPFLHRTESGKVLC